MIILIHFMMRFMICDPFMMCFMICDVFCDPFHQKSYEDPKSIAGIEKIRSSSETACISPYPIVVIVDNDLKKWYMILFYDIFVMCLMFYDVFFTFCDAFDVLWCVWSFMMCLWYFCDVFLMLMMWYMICFLIPIICHNICFSFLIPR